MHIAFPESFLSARHPTSYLTPFAISGVSYAFGALFFCISTLTKLHLSHAYPFVTLSFLTIACVSALFFNEATRNKVFWYHTRNTAIAPVALQTLEQIRMVIAKHFYYQNITMFNFAITLQ